MDVCVCVCLYDVVYLFNCVSARESNSTKQTERKRTVNTASGTVRFTLTKAMQTHSLLPFVYSFSNTNDIHTLLSLMPMMLVLLLRMLRHASQLHAHQNTTMEISIHMKIDQMITEKKTECK